jgi:hypothetical protein
MLKAPLVAEGNLKRLFGWAEYFRPVLFSHIKRGQAGKGFQKNSYRIPGIKKGLIIR